jgi:hypothetical protein
MAEILRSSEHKRTWVVPIAGGFEPVSIEAHPDDGLIRLAVAGVKTGPDPAELRAIATACHEAADLVEFDD